MKVIGVFFLVFTISASYAYLNIGEERSEAKTQGN